MNDLDHIGWSISNILDVDSDGFIELIAGATGDDDGGTDRGAVYILHLNNDGTVLH